MRGDVLIERQIKQLKAAGVNDIVIVVGYKKESFFYLEDKYGVKIVVNRAYAERNNNSSLMLVRSDSGQHLHLLFRQLLRGKPLRKPRVESVLLRRILRRPHEGMVHANQVA